jgi:hypothetical protein
MKRISYARTMSSAKVKPEIKKRAKVNPLGQRKLGGSLEEPIRFMTSLNHKR